MCNFVAALSAPDTPSVLARALLVWVSPTDAVFSAWSMKEWKNWILSRT